MRNPKAAKYRMDDEISKIITAFTKKTGLTVVSIVVSESEFKNSDNELEKRLFATTKVILE